MVNDFPATLASAKLTNAARIDGTERNGTETCLLVWRMRTSVRISAQQQMYETTAHGVDGGHSKTRRMNTLRDIIAKTSRSFPSSRVPAHLIRHRYMNTIQFDASASIKEH